MEPSRVRRIAHAFWGRATRRRTRAHAGGAGLDLARRLHVGHVRCDRRAGGAEGARETAKGSASISRSINGSPGARRDRAGFSGERLCSGTDERRRRQCLPHSHYQTKTEVDRTRCTNDQMFARLADAMEQPELASRPDMVRKELRLAARDKVNGIVAAWVASLDLETVLARCAEGRRAGEPDLQRRRHFRRSAISRARKYQEWRNRVATLPSPRSAAAVGDARRIRWLGEGLGAQNEEIFKVCSN